MSNLYYTIIDLSDIANSGLWFCKQKFAKISISEAKVAKISISELISMQPITDTNTIYAENGIQFAHTRI